MNANPDNQKRIRRDRVLRVVASEDEASRIAKNAQMAECSISAYLRETGLGMVPSSTLDQELIHKLVIINGDQGRLGGLLKLWLSTRPGEGASAFEVRKLLRQIEATQDQLKEAIGRL